MKSYLFALIFTTSCLVSLSQIKSDTTLLILKPKDNIKLFAQNTSSEYDYIYTNADKILILYGNSEDTITKSFRTAKVFYEGRHYRCNANSLGLTHDQISIVAKWTDEWENQRGFIAERQHALVSKYLANEQRIKYLNSILEVNEAKKAGLIFMWDWSESGNSIKSQDFNFEIINTTKKKIKYIWANVSLKNPVGDFIAKKNLTLVGPLEPYLKSKYEFENVFFSNIADRANINSLKVQYFDGTIKLYTGTLLSKVLVSNEDYSNWLEYVDNEAEK